MSEAMVSMNPSDRGWIMKVIIASVSAIVVAMIAQTIAIVQWGVKLETRVTMLENGKVQTDEVIRAELRPVINSMNQLIGEVRASKVK